MQGLLLLLLRPVAAAWGWLAARAAVREAAAAAHLKRALNTIRGRLRTNHQQAQFAAVRGDHAAAIRRSRSIAIDARLPDGGSTRFVKGPREPSEQWLDERPVHQCTHCGFAARTLRWQRPSHRRWSRIERRLNAECEPREALGATSN